MKLAFAVKNFSYPMYKVLYFWSRKNPTCVTRKFLNLHWQIWVVESCLIISNHATEISREFCDVQARTLFFHTLCSDLDYFTVLIPEKPDEDSVNIHVIATVTACVTVVIILGVIIAYKRYVALQIRGDLRGGLGCRLMISQAWFPKNCRVMP